MKQIFNTKREEIKSRINQLKTADNISKMTRNTQLSAKRRELATLDLIDELLAMQDYNTAKLSAQAKEQLIKLTTLAEERTQGAAIEIKAGDNILTIMKQYGNLTNFAKRLDKRCMQLHLKLNDSGVFEEA